MSRLKAVLRRAVQTFGYDFVDAEGYDSLTRHLQELLPALDVKCVLDVGAHTGEYGRILRELGYRGHIVSLEPVEASFTRLRQIAEHDPRWRVHRLALGSTAGERPIHVSAATQFASFLPANDYGRQLFPRQIAVDHSEVVPVARLETLFDELVAHVDGGSFFLKTDTQGYDLAVLEGAGECLSRFAGVQLELPIKPIYGGMPGLAESLARLAEWGFEPSGLFPVSRDADGLRIVEVDCVLISTPPASRRAERD